MLSHNRFKALPLVLYSLERLENLFADGNEIAVIEVGGLLRLKMLSCLNLQNNNISQVPPELGNVEWLKLVERYL